MEIGLRMKKEQVYVLILLAVLFGAAACLALGLMADRRNESIESANVFMEETPEITSGWVEENGEWFYINDGTGEKASGWLEVEGEKYYLNPETKVRQKGLLKLSENEWYFFDEQGKMLTNCVAENYVLNETGRVERLILSDEEKENRKQQMQPIIDEISKKYGATGVSVALIENGEVTDNWQYGWAVKNSVAMSADTKIRIASITKVILAMNGFKMAENGIVDIDESIGTYWGFPVANPNFPNDAITLRNIFSHTSSIADIDSYKNIEGRLRGNGIFRNVKPSDPAGWSYCNYAFGVAGTTLEKAANKTIYQISQENFFEPMGIDASFAAGRLKNKELLASLYYADGSLARSRETMAGFVGNDTPGNNGAFMMGGLCISAQDLAKMISILANDGVYQGTRYLTEESINTMEAQYCPATLHEVEVVQCFPLKYLTDIYGEENLYFHTGSSYGVYTLFSYNPDTKNGVVVLTTGASGTCDEYGIYAVCGEISEVLYQEVKKLMM